MKVVVGPLAQSGLESRVGPNLPAAVNTALVYYVGKLNSGRRPAAFPKFLSTQGNSDDPEGAVPGEAGSSARPEIEVEVDEQIEAALFTDAANQGVSPTDLAGHAVLVYLAELELVGDPAPVEPPRMRGFTRSSRAARRSAH